MALDIDPNRRAYRPAVGALGLPVVVRRNPGDRSSGRNRKVLATILLDPEDSLDQPALVQAFLQRAVLERVSVLFFAAGRKIVAKIDFEFVEATDHQLEFRDITGLHDFLFGAEPPSARPDGYWHKFGRVNLHGNEYLRYEAIETENRNSSEPRSREIVLRLLPKILPYIVDYDLPRSFWDDLPRAGLILVSGDSDSDATGLIAAVARASLEDFRIEHRAVVFALPDYSFPRQLHSIEWERSSILQIETRPGEPLDREMAMASSIGADMIAIGTCHDNTTMEIALALAAEGKRVLLGLTASGVLNTVARALALLSQGRCDKMVPGLPEFALNLRAVVSQKMVRNLQGSVSALQEYLIVGPTLREALLQTAPGTWMLAVLRNFEEEGESFAASAMAASKAGRISDEVRRRVALQTTAPIIPRRPGKASKSHQET